MTDYSDKLEAAMTAETLKAVREALLRIATDRNVFSETEVADNSPRHIAKEALRLIDAETKEERGYRMLDVDETIKQGDQFSAGPHWINSMAAGETILPCDAGRYRRPITKP